MNTVRLVLLAAACFVANLGAVASAAVNVDPTGDTFAAGPDITTITTTISSGNLVFVIDFLAPISAPSAGVFPNSVVGYIDLDTDQNAATGGSGPFFGPVLGGNSWINVFIPPNPGLPSIPGPLVPLGDDYYVDLWSEGGPGHMGTVDVVRTSDNTVTGTAPVTYVGSQLTVTIPLSFLGGDDGIANFGILVGNFAAPTDRAPNGDAPLSTVDVQIPVPEPASLALFGMGMACVIGYARRSHRGSRYV
jgi:PEP-CTERM motif